MQQRFEIGDDCPHCSGPIGVLNTRVIAQTRVRWIGCRDCGWRPEDNKHLIPVSMAPRQRPRLSRLQFGD